MSAEIAGHAIDQQAIDGPANHVSPKSKKRAITLRVSQTFN